MADWYSQQSDAIQAAFDTSLLHLAQIVNWREPLAKKLENANGIIEIRFKAGGVQQRPLGFYGPNRMQFTILVCAIEKNNRFVPPDAIAIAENRKAEVEQDARFSKIWILDR